jgi:acyl dehydratase
MRPIAPMYFEDLAVGQTFRSQSDSIDPERMKAFAAEFDPQPFHLDEEAAAGSLFGGLVASGWYTAALTMRLLVESELQIAGGLVGAGVEEIRWPRAVRPGDVLRVESEVIGLRPSQSRPDRGIVRIRSTTLNQEGQPVMIQVANLIVPRRPPDPPGAAGA